MSKTTPAPLTEDERATLAQLKEREKAEQEANAEADRQAKLAAMGGVGELLGLFNLDTIKTKVNAIMSETGVDFETKQLVKTFCSSVEFNMTQLRAKLDSLSTPAPKET